VAGHWQNIADDVRACDILIFMSLDGERACSGLIEVGLAIAHGKPIFCISRDWWSYSELPNVRCFKSLEPAIEALVAMAAGERARNDMLAGLREVAA
jgi:nucleoside 2-deoxyribosyltransferase